MTPRHAFRVVVTVFCAVTLQGTVLLDVRIGGVHPDVMVLLPVAAGLAGGPAQGATVGFWTGLVADLFLPPVPIQKALLRGHPHTHKQKLRAAGRYTGDHARLLRRPEVPVGRTGNPKAGMAEPRLLRSARDDLWSRPQEEDGTTGGCGQREEGIHELDARKPSRARVPQASCRPDHPDAIRKRQRSRSSGREQFRILTGPHDQFGIRSEDHGRRVGAPVGQKRRGAKPRLISRHGIDRHTEDV